MTSDDVKVIEEGKSRRFGGLVEIALAGIVVAGVFSNDWVPPLTNAWVSTVNAYAAGERAKAGLNLQTGDYNGNNQIDSFYQVGYTKVPVEVDGKPVGHYFSGAK